MQPVFVEDYADRIVSAGATTESLTVDVAGPEIFTFEGLVRMLRDAMARRTVLMRVPPTVALAGAMLVGVAVRDMALTGAEVRGLMAELLISHQPSTCPTRLSDWARQHQEELGIRWSSELGRHYR